MGGEENFGSTSVKNPASRGGFSRPDNPSKSEHGCAGGFLITQVKFFVKFLENFSGGIIIMPNYNLLKNSEYG